MRETVPALAGLAAEGHELLVTHGNGPQVGAALRQNELAGREVPARPLHVLDAETQGQIGFLIQQELSAALERLKVPRVVLTWITRIEVARNDPAFRRPSKPVGRYYSESEARVLKKREGWQMAYDGARGGWRRVVPSPRPKAWLEGETVVRILDSGLGERCVPILGGGGGIPVVRSRMGEYSGVEAVIDKDLTAALIASAVHADTLAIVTDVPAVAVGFRKPWERWLGEASAAELEKALRAGEFAEGSMRPKVEAGLSFLGHGGRRLLITDGPSLSRAFHGEAGTRVLRD